MLCIFSFKCFTKSSANWVHAVKLYKTKFCMKSLSKQCPNRMQMYRGKAFFNMFSQ